MTFPDCSSLRLFEQNINGKIEALPVQTDLSATNRPCSLHSLTDPNQKFVFENSEILTCFGPLSIFFLSFPFPFPFPFLFFAVGWFFFVCLFLACVCG